ncbi:MULTISPECIES: SH3 domain-containing protein [Anaerococcus]|uniref:SH3 domain-containing protein n=1 Tax=Anaerococcus cruorum TaxID=3115617 RepID=A0ABW9MXS9_9FIRM
MNKRKLLLALTLTLALTGCSDDNYVSKRHPEGEVREVTEEDMQEQSENPEETQTDSQDTEDTSNEENQPEEAVDDGINYTVENTVNVRVAPSETSNVMTTVEAGDDILKLGESDNWTRISIDGQTGYIRSDLLVAK